MPHLMNHTTGEILLEIPIINREDDFVREHAHRSPREDVRLFGKDLFSEAMRRQKEENPERFTKEEDIYLTERKSEYNNSIVMLNDYVGEFRAPELWVPQETPVSLIREVNDKLAVG